MDCPAKSTASTSSGQRQQNRGKNKFKKKPGGQQQGRPGGSRNSPLDRNNANQKQKKKGQRMRIKEKLAAITRDRAPARPIEKVCTNFMRSQCFTENCKFSHLIKPKRRQGCRYWLMERCLQGDKCHYSHSTPCKFHLLYNSCKEGAGCRFSHQIPRTDSDRQIYIRELKLDPPPKVIHHDFSRAPPKTGHHSAVSRVAAPPEPAAETLLGVATEGCEAESEEVIREKQGPIVGFYKDTLVSDDEERPEHSVSTPGSVFEELEKCPAPVATVPPDSAPFLEEIEIISGIPEETLEFGVRQILNWRKVDYSDVRKALPPACTIIDPRLRHGPKLFPKPVEELIGPAPPFTE